MLLPLRVPFRGYARSPAHRTPASCCTAPVDTHARRTVAFRRLRFCLRNFTLRAAHRHTRCSAACLLEVRCLLLRTALRLSAAALCRSRMTFCACTLTRIRIAHCARRIRVSMVHGAWICWRAPPARLTLPVRASPHAPLFSRTTAARGTYCCRAALRGS